MESMIQIESESACAAFMRVCVSAAILIAPAVAQIGPFSPDPGCSRGQSWSIQANARTDSTGLRNVAYPETNAFDWFTALPANLGPTAVIRGQYPASRYMSLELYDGQGNVVGAINGASIDPDLGTNNPYRSGTAQGNYKVTLDARQPPLEPAANTLYTSGKNNLWLVYRIYYPNDPTSVTGGTTNPALPVVTVAGITLPVCPPRPIISPVTATVWGRLDLIDFEGTKPPTPVQATNPPTIIAVSTNSNTPYFPSQDNSYLGAMLSRDYLNPPYSYDMVVMRFRAPTFPDTQAGVLASGPAQVRYWSVCTDEVLSTAVVRCAPDDRSVNVDGFVTIVISDPSKMPSSAVLNQWGATWVAWGALEPTDVMYNVRGQALTNADGVFYYNPILYRQTEATSSWAQSIRNVSKLPVALQPAAMGDYWPTIAYCTASQFETLGAGCIPPPGSTSK